MRSELVRIRKQAVPPLVSLNCCVQSITCWNGPMRIVPSSEMVCFGVGRNPAEFGEDLNWEHPLSCHEDLPIQCRACFGAGRPHLMLGMSWCGTSASLPRAWLLCLCQVGSRT